jgi:hypothetical protein
MSSCWLVDRHRASENHGYEKAPCEDNITRLKNKGHTSAHRELRKQAECRSSHRKDQRDLRQDLSQQTAVEQHHRTDPTSTKDVCTYIMEQTQGSTWQLKTFLTHTRHHTGHNSLFYWFLPFCSTRCFYLALMFTERQFLHNRYHRSLRWLLTHKF